MQCVLHRCAHDGSIGLPGNIVSIDGTEAFVQSSGGIREAVGLDALRLDQDLISLTEGLHIIVGGSLVQSDLAQADLRQSAGLQDFVVSGDSHKVFTLTDGDGGQLPFPGKVCLVQVQVQHALELIQSGVITCLKGKDRTDESIVIALVFHEDHLIQLVVDLLGVPDAGGVAILADLSPVHIGITRTEIIAVFIDTGVQGLVIAELLNLSVLILGFVIDPLILQLIDSYLAQRHNIDIFVSVRQVG